MANGTPSVHSSHVHLTDRGRGTCIGPASARPRPEWRGLPLLLFSLPTRGPLSPVTFAELSRRHRPRLRGPLALLRGRWHGRGQLLCRRDSFYPPVLPLSVLGKRVLRWFSSRPAQLGSAGLRSQ